MDHYWYSIGPRPQVFLMVGSTQLLRTTTEQFKHWMALMLQFGTFHPKKSYCHLQIIAWMWQALHYPDATHIQLPDYKPIKPRCKLVFCCILYSRNIISCKFSHTLWMSGLCPLSKHVMGRDDLDLSCQDIHPKNPLNWYTSFFTE